MDGLSCKKLTESLVYMARKHVHVIENRSRYSQNVFCAFFFYYFGVHHIAENFPFFLQLVEVIWKTAANPGETLHGLMQENMRIFWHFTA